MTWFEAFLLGIMQGLGEFLPISSSGHVALGTELLGIKQTGEENMLFTVVVHVATALSTIIVFRNDIWQIFKGLFSFKWNDETKFSLKIIISMIPAVFIGLFFEDQLDEFFAQGMAMFVGFMLLITALLLLLADKAKFTGKPVSFGNAVVIGIAQAIAILPGISRSGATISTSVLLGVDRAQAARFSFLMVIPLILGKMSKDILDGKVTASSDSALPLAVGFITSFVVGLFACSLMIKLVRNSKLKYFAYYCFVAGILAIILGFFIA
jgi:undecaprenyl-diphosphatase